MYTSFRCFSACTMIENVTYDATIEHYNTLLQYDATKLTHRPCDWRRAIFLQADPASAQSRLDSYLILFPPGEQFDKQTTQRRAEGRQDRLIRLTGKTLLVLLPSMPDSLYQLCTMNCGRRQGLNFLAGRERVTILRYEGIWRYKYHTQISSCEAD